ncbi:MAG: hypothetical protein GY714_09100 [Desulfobacterales bacterium]|nr:hypothetical protein [Desulfobacterales bacterium]
MNKILIILIVFSISVASGSSIKNLGTFGSTYEIAEKNALDEFKKRSAEVNWKKHVDGAKKRVHEYRPKGLKNFPRAKEDRTFLADMTSTLAMDIPNKDGGILYPKGYQYNPLDYMTYHEIIVLIDATDKKQIDWFLKSKYKNNLKTKLLLTNGSAIEFSEKHNMVVFYSNKIITDRLQIKALPSIAMQKDRHMEVREICVENKKK